MCKCLGKYQQEHMNIAWWLAMPVSVGPLLEGKLVHPSESHFCHACWALLPASSCLAPRPYRTAAGQRSKAAFYQLLEIGLVSTSKSLIWCYAVGQNALLFRPYCQSLLLLQHRDLVFGAM